MGKKHFILKRNTIIIFIIMSFTSIIFLKSLTFDKNTYSSYRLLAYLFAFLIIFIPTIIVSFSKSKLSKQIDVLLLKSKELYLEIKSSPISYLKILSIYTIGIFASIFCVHFSRIIGITSQSNSRLLFFWILLFFSFITITIYRKKNFEKPEDLFFILSIIMGLFFASMYTVATWDEQIHYLNSNSLFSFFTHNELLSNKLFSSTLGNYPYADLNEGFKTRITIPYTFKFEPNTFSYLPEFIGLIIGRGLNMSFAHTFLLGKICNLLFFSLIMRSAIKITPYGKNILLAIGLSATVLFQAGSYTYDPWVISFISLGYSYIFKCYESANNTLTLKEALLGILYIFIGCMPKAIYFPLFIAFFFIPKERYISKKHKQYVMLFTILAILALLFLIIVPNYLLPSANISDIRGGTKVDGHAQIIFILSNPLKYAKILLLFLIKDYLPLENASSYLTNFSYHGEMRLCFFPVFTIILSSLFDAHRPNTDIRFFRIINYILIICCIILIATSLYITFTPVKNNTINGCQPRYLLPLIFPTVYLLKPNFFRIEIRSNTLTTLVSVSMTFTFFFSIFSTFFLNNMF